ncbi:hypothetical protein ACFFIX_23880 [Metabacillus herbersteinensis]|uniref:aconitate hydratase n=1 Tax=Metabacillus herbersteinensis TaxID=283816 RepID=A0ABV6GLL5_9BACI
MNIIEKNLAQKANLDTVIPRERVILEPSFMFISENSALSVINEFRDLGYQKVLYPSQTIFELDPDIPFNQRTEMKDFCDVNGLKILDKCGSFLSDLLIGKQNNLHDLVVAGVDRSIGVLGAFGAVPLIISPSSMARCLGTGKVEMIIPETVYIEISGFLKSGANAEGICDYLLDYFEDSLVGCGIIVGGNTIEQLDHEGRGRITRFIHDSGGALGIISPDGPNGQVESVVKIKAHCIPEVH